jgi:hypothetical protein
MKRFALTLLALAMTKIAAFSVDLGVRSGGTPYDRYLGPVRTVLGSLDKKKADMDTVKKLMKQGRSFRYHLDDPYVPAMPSVTAKEREGDCKDKALWLCDQLGDSSVRFVIGKTSNRAKISHAWVMWQNEGRWWVLDCTLKSAPIAADTLPANQYIPLYSYSKGTCYRHGVSGMNVAAIASEKSSTVAAGAQR